MNQLLTNFVRALRASDVRVSTSESIDAAQTIGAIGFSDRELLKESLSQVLAKSAEEKRRFADCFDRYFFAEDMRGVDSLSADEVQANSPDEPSLPGDTENPAGRANGEGQGDGEGGENADRLSTANRTDLQIAVANAARQAGVSNIRLFTQRGMYMRRILEIVGIETLEEQIRDAEADLAAQLSERRAQLIEEVRAQVDRQLLLYTANSWPELREQILRKTPLSSVEVRDFKFMQALVHKLAKRLVSLHSRKKKVARRGQLDVRQTIRRNIEYDGLLFNTVWKRKKIDRPKVIAVCDVSGSVATAARFLLMFLYSVTEVIPKVRAFAFSNQLAEITDLFQNAPAQDAISAALQLHGWGSTDYGRAFEDLESMVLDDVDHRTTVLILGDGRSNYGDPGVAHLRKIHERARRVIWLNPEPMAFWNSGDSEMRRFSSACDRVDVCRSIQDLERLVSEIMRSAV
ncbi:MAG: VWA domain-containing protein [Proteobacteria bacterium]|nr:VWA domain-containing protein [Pseudomonadota bacterium]